MAITEAQVRRLVQDNPDGGGTNILASDDYSLIITTEPKLYRAAALAARMIASTFAEKVEIAAGSAKIRLQQKYRQYMHYANAFDSRAEEGDLSGATPQLHGISIAD
ncbi:MAG: hypothetical protein GWO20_08255, partial [Candidatus Korarchaeota archaeon]|nr:hypothetical protein [Candidatus Korarchaeota archaeon]NIU83471.1 hypothetical protein [Candidatus Thorarchaeota archaeon]